MKTILSLVLIALSFSSESSQTLRIRGVVPREREGLFWLKSSSSTKVSLDCSSFLQNLTLTPPAGHPVIFYLTIQECVELYDFYRGFNLRARCLSVDESFPRAHFCSSRESQP
ncbi:MAG: hypothetical protein LW878_12255 [Proteobacteria bacterium]|jgi:hypothetical protein|nr:hypothetical protein [Pseudomonadota bacterium]